MISRIVCVVLFMLLVSSAVAEPLKVASLNPIVSDLARQVGGKDVNVVDLMPVGSNPHTYQPTPAHMKEASRAVVVLAAGKRLETYLPDFKGSLGDDTKVFEVGRNVPSLLVTAGDVFICCPAHAQGAIDPHWWHSVKNAKRASKTIADLFVEIDPVNAAAYAQRYQHYAATLDDLYRWGRKQIAKIPRRDRELTTSHAAFGYLCREMGLRSITVQGLTTEDNPDPGYLKDVIKILRDEDVKAVFPENNANPKVLKSMVMETGVRLGGALFAGSPPPETPTYEAMIRANITTIVEGLLPEKE